MDLTVNLAPSYRDLKDPTTRQNFDDTVEQKRVIDLRACHIFLKGRDTTTSKTMFSRVSIGLAPFDFIPLR